VAVGVGAGAGPPVEHAAAAQAGRL